MYTEALEQLYPHMNAEEIAKQRSLNDDSTEIQYEPIGGSPFRMAKKGGKWHLLMGNWKLTQEGEEQDDIGKLLDWTVVNSWTITQRMIGCICYDFMKPLATIQGVQAAKEGIKINKPE